MHTDPTEDSTASTPIASDSEATMKRPRPPITIHPPQRDGDRDILIAALAAAVVAIARRNAARSDDLGSDSHEPYTRTVDTA